MDSMITAAAQALAAGDPLGALKRVALRDDPPALALRAIAMAQLGDLSRARLLIRKAARAFGPKEAISRARCVVAEAEIAFASRDLNWPTKELEAARRILADSGDEPNAVHARYLDIRWLLLIGRLDDAERALGTMRPAGLTPVHRAIHELIVAGIAVRRLQVKAARTALDRAMRAASEAKVLALSAEISIARQALEMPVARLMDRGKTKVLRLDEVEALFQSRDLIVDACRFEVRVARNVVQLTSRPVLFTLARALAKGWPNDVPREELITAAFRVKLADESFRSRLRVEIGRLRKMLHGVADIEATTRGFVIEPKDARNVVTLALPAEEAHADVLAFLADGESWSSSALALAMGSSQRTVQRALDALAASGKIEALGFGRARRWVMAPVPGFTTSLLLPPAMPAD